MKKILEAFKTLGVFLLLLICIIVLFASAPKIFGQDRANYSSEKYVVQVGWKQGKFNPDTLGIRLAFERADFLKLFYPGQFINVEFEPGVYNLSKGIKLRDSINILAEGCVFNCTDSLHGTFYDDSTNVKVSIKGIPCINNTAGISKRIVRKNVNTKISNFYWEYVGLYNHNDEDTVTIIPLVNTLGITGWTNVNGEMFPHENFISQGVFYYSSNILVGEILQIDISTRVLLNIDYVNEYKALSVKFLDATTGLPMILPDFSKTISFTVYP